MIKLYVWQGDKVLRNYSSGLVVVAASSPDEAWAKLFAADHCAAFWLKHGISYIFEPGDEAMLDAEDFPDTGYPIEPEAFDLESLPVLVKHGGG